MRNTILICFVFIFLFVDKSYSQYDPQYVETKTVSISGDTYAIEKLMRKDNRIKVKYFAAKDYGGTSVYQKYSNWSSSKKVVAVSSGTYMTDCIASIASPVGLCIDNGVVVNENLSDNLDGLVIVYATGGAVATNLKVGDLSITYQNGTKKTVDIKNNAFQRAEFIKWAKDLSATVFQTHLFVYKDNITISPFNSSSVIAPRRFLAVCRIGGEIVHYIINLPFSASLYNGSIKAYNYLKKYEDVTEVTFMINLDPGCQNIYQVYNKNGTISNDSNFKGDVSIINAANLLVYYYE